MSIWDQIPSIQWIKETEYQILHSSSSRWVRDDKQPTAIYYWFKSLSIKNSSMTNRVMKSLFQHQIAIPHLPDILLLPGMAEASFESHLLNANACRQLPQIHWVAKGPVLCNTECRKQHTLPGIAAKGLFYINSLSNINPSFKVHRRSLT